MIELCNDILLSFVVEYFEEFINIPPPGEVRSIIESVGGY